MKGHGIVEGVVMDCVRPHPHVQAWLCQHDNPLCAWGTPSHDLWVGLWPNGDVSTPCS